MKIHKDPTIIVFIYPTAIGLAKLTQETIEGVVTGHLFPTEDLAQGQIVTGYLCAKNLVGVTPNTYQKRFYDVQRFVTSIRSGLR
jgi:hypothetical protein